MRETLGTGIKGLARKLGSRQCEVIGLPEVPAGQDPYFPNALRISVTAASRPRFFAIC